MSSSLSRIAIAQQGEDLISFERVAIVTQTSVNTIQSLSNYWALSNQKALC